MTSPRNRGAARENEPIEDGEDLGAELIAEGLGAFYKSKRGRRLLRDGGSQSLGGLLFAWADVGVQVMRRMVTLGAELGDGVFGQTFGGGGGESDNVAVDEPVRLTATRGTASGSFTLENRRSGHVDVRLPRVAEFHAEDGRDRQLVQLHFDPEAPLVGADAKATVSVRFATDKFKPGTRYIGWVTIETARGGRSSLAIECLPEAPATPPSPSKEAE